MSATVQTKVQIGQHATPANNFVWERDAATGVLVLRRGTHDVEGTQLIKVNADGGVNLKGPLFLARKSADQNGIATQTRTKLLYATEVTDTNACYDHTISRFKPNVAGWYWLQTSFVCNLTTLNYVCAWLYKNGVLEVGGPISSTANGTYTNVAAGLIYCDGVNDYVEAYGEATGAMWNATMSSANATFSGFLVRAA